MKDRLNLPTNLTSQWAKLAAVGVMLAGCQFLPDADEISQTVAPPAPTGERVTFDKLRQKDPQSKIGALGHPKVLAANGGVYSNQKLEELLALITGELVSKSGDPERAFDITILDSSAINAFALPGGYLYITRGLLALANDTSEIAAVLAHEMAHVSSNHGIKRNNQVKATDIADRVANQVVSNPVVSQITKASAEQRLERFSKNQELQADAVGIKLMGKAGFDPFAAARFLESMDRFSSWRSVLAEEALDISKSHPSTPQRIELARRHARNIGPQGSFKPNKKRYLAGIEGMEFGDTTRQGVIRGQRFYHAKQGFTFEAPQNFDLSNRQDAVLISGPNQMAVRFDAVKRSRKKIDPVTYIKSGWLNGLQGNSVRPQTINGLQAASARATASDWNFVVTVIELDGRYYRFILAAPRGTTDIETPASKIASSFRRTTNKDKAALKPLRIKIARVGAADTVDSLSKRMRGVARKRQLFLALNGLSEGQRPSTGSQIKIVTD